MFTIFMLVILALFAIGGLVVAAKSKKVTHHDDTNGLYGHRQQHEFPVRRIGFIVAGISAALLVITTMLAGLYSQDPGQAKVLRSFTGEVLDADTTEGLGFKAPWVNTVDYDIRNQTIEYIGDGSSAKANSEERVEGPAIPAQDKDGATATLDIVVRYSINPTSVEEIYKEYGAQDNFESKLIQNDVRAVVRNIPLQYSTTEFRLNREAAALEMQKALSERWLDDGIIVDSVDLRDIRYPENIELSLQAVQEAINNANKAKADLETAKVDAEKTRVEAQAQADYDQIVRCGATTTTVKEVINGTETNVVKVIPLQGDECQDRLNEQVLTNKYIDALKELGKDGNVIVVPQGSNPLVQVPAPATK